MLVTFFNGFLVQVATALLVAGATLTLWTPGQLCLHPPAHTQASFKGCLYRSNVGTEQLMAHPN